MKTLSENTQVTIGLVVILAGGIFWLSMMFAQGNENTRQIAEIRSDQRAYVEMVRRVDSRLYKIEGALGVKNAEPLHGGE